MMTITRLARQFGLSRATLLYYDRIGLLRPQGRSAAGYRLYTDADVQRLEQIRLYREAGLDLEAVRQLLGAPGDATRPVLEARLAQLNAEMHALRRQQRMLLGLLRAGGTPPPARIMDKQRWVALLRAAGMGEAEMARWHIEFERTAPEAHADFLESLGLEAAEVAAIRSWSRERGGADG